MVSSFGRQQVRCYLSEFMACKCYYCHVFVMCSFNIWNEAFCWGLALLLFYFFLTFPSVVLLFLYFQSYFCPIFFLYFLLLYYFFYIFSPIFVLFFSYIIFPTLYFLLFLYFQSYFCPIFVLFFSYISYFFIRVCWTACLF